jgi:hypothetical protein
MEASSDRRDRRPSRNVAGTQPMLFGTGIDTRAIKVYFATLRARAVVGGCATAAHCSSEREQCEPGVRRSGVSYFTAQQRTRGIAPRLKEPTRSARGTREVINMPSHLIQIGPAHHVETDHLESSPGRLPACIQHDQHRRSLLHRFGFRRRSA